MGVLDGYRVLDLSIAMSGPFAAMRLGDLGADVIKVEPVTGEWQRHVAAGGACGNRVNVSFLSLNRNKRSLAVNLKADEGREIVYKLAKTADVFLQNYRPGVAQRLGVDYASIRELNARIVYVSISGYGEEGPYVHRPGQDLLLQGLSGAMLSAGRTTDPPQPAPMYVVDAVTAYSAFEGALAALLHRERTGQGQLVEVNMLDAIIALQMQEMSVFTVGHQPQRRTDEPHAHCYIRAPYSGFATAEGYLILAFPPLKKLGEVLEIPELLEMSDERDGHDRRDEIHQAVQKRLLDKPAAEWLVLLEEHGIWAGPVYSYEDVVSDPQVHINGSLVTYEHPTEGRVTTPGFPIRFKGTPSEVRMGAPLAGQHTREILAELDISPRRVDQLVDSGVLAAEEQEPDVSAGAVR
ncbi:MAG: CoA transferase [Solirubrobacterales bacterium]|nr:CoA transferase [Solirubrobacterales bacterium]